MLLAWTLSRFTLSCYNDGCIKTTVRENYYAHKKADVYGSGVPFSLQVQYLSVTRIAVAVASILTRLEGDVLGVSRRMPVVTV